MSNSLNNDIDKILAMSLDVLRENCVMPRIVNTSYGADALAKGATVDIPVAGESTVRDATPGQVPNTSNVTNMTSTLKQISLNQFKDVEFAITDKELFEVREGDVLPRQIKSALKGLANTVDRYIFSKCTSFYNHVGTAGTTPFGTSGDISDATNSRKMLNKYLAPLSDRYGLLDPDAEANALAQPAFYQAYLRGDTGGVIDGTLATKFGIDWVMSQNVPTHTNGTLSDGTAHKALINSASVAVGDTSVAMDETTLTGTVKVGDLFTVNGDSQQYTITADATAASNAITVSFSPAAKVAWADNAQVTFVGDSGGTFVDNLVFNSDAIAFASRPLQNLVLPGQAGAMIQTVVDDVSGLAFTMEIVRQHHQTAMNISCLYGAEVIRPELGVRLLG